MAANPDDLIAKLAAEQHGLLTRAQLLEHGVTAHTVTARVRARRFRLVHRGVYLIGPLVSPRAREMAAVLACGPGAAVSHASAARLWSPAPDRSRSRSPHGAHAVDVTGAIPPVDITIARGDRRHRSGIRVHRAASLEPEDMAILDGIPVTTPVRTLLDLAGVTGRRELEEAVARAERDGLIDRVELRGIVAHRAGRPGSRVLRDLLGGDAPLAITRSEAEERLLALLRKAQLPGPHTNAPIGNYEVDFLWKREQLVVEVDGFAHHASRHRFEGDRRRDATLTARGLRVMRVTWRQIVDEPMAVAARIAQALARSAIS